VRGSISGAVEALRRILLGVSPEEIRTSVEDVRSELRAARAELKGEISELRRDVDALRARGEDRPQGAELPVAEA
jgi:signal transduction histidine kinase